MSRKVNLTCPKNAQTCLLLPKDVLRSKNQGPIQFYLSPNLLAWTEPIISGPERLHVPRAEAGLRQRRNDLRHDLLLERGVHEEGKAGQVQPGAHHDVLGSMQRRWWSFFLIKVRPQALFFFIELRYISHCTTGVHINKWTHATHVYE